MNGVSGLNEWAKEKALTRVLQVSAFYASFLLLDGGASVDKLSDVTMPDSYRLSGVAPREFGKGCRAIGRFCGYRRPTRTDNLPVSNAIISVGERGNVLVWAHALVLS